MISCGEDMVKTSIVLENNRKKTNTEKYIPKRGIPEKKQVEFELLERNAPIDITNKLVTSWFNDVKTTEDFKREIDVDSNNQVTFIFTDKLVKDLNGDRVNDLILLITKDINDKRSFTRHYLIAFNDGKKLIPIEYFFAGSFESEQLIQFNQITDSLTVKGELTPNHFIKSKDTFPIEYYFDGREFISK